MKGDVEEVYQVGIGEVSQPDSNLSLINAPLPLCHPCIVGS
jgi:hypothetical protein